MKRLKVVFACFLLLAGGVVAFRLVRGRGAVVPCRKEACCPGVPEVLRVRGFGDREEPVTIVCTSNRAGDPDMVITLPGTGAAAPNSTKWVFADPAPVWLCFAGTGEGVFAEGAYAAAKASVVLSVGTGKAMRSVVFGCEPGQATVVTAKGSPEGGDWELDAAVAKALARLLSLTPPAD